MDIIILSDAADSTFNSLIFRYIGPYKVAHSLRASGYDAQVIDFVMLMDEDTLYSLIKKFITPKTGVLGISGTFICQTLYKHSDGISRMVPEHVFNCLSRIKQEYPNIKLLAGGYTTYGLSGHVDIIINGEAEDTIVDVMNFLRTGKDEPPYEVISTPFNNRLQKIYTGPVTKRFNIETDKFKFSKQDVIIPGETLPIEVSRGCIFKCKFCRFRHIGKHKFDYLRSMDLVKEEMIYNYENFNVTNYNIICDTFNDSDYKMNLWHNAISSLPFKIKFNAYVRADLIHRFRDTADMLYDTGLTGAYHGVESFHPLTSMIVGKGWSGKYGKEFLPELYHNIWKGKVVQHLNFIVGLPKDTIESINDTLNWFVENNMHSIKFDPLGMSEYHSLGRWAEQSEFEKNSVKYGYSFVDGKWVNGDWSRQRAVYEAAKLDIRAAKYNKPNSWTAVNALTYNIPNADVFLSCREFNKKYNFPKLRTEFVQQYAKNLALL